MNEEVALPPLEKSFSPVRTFGKVFSIAALIFVNFTSVDASQPTFGVFRQLWTNLNPNIGGLAALTNTAYNSKWPNNPATGFTKVFTNFETEINSGMNYYGQRVRAFVVPPVSGNYTFWIASDDNSELFLSSDETLAKIHQIAQVSTWTSSENWYSESDQKSSPIPLQGGQRYYIEAIMQQGGGGDNLAVRWQLPDGTFEEPMTGNSAAGTFLIPYDGLTNKPGIYLQSTNLTIIENTTATLSVLATNTASLSYQWQLNGTNIITPAAHQSVFLVSNASVAINNGQTYSCVLSNTAGHVVSQPIVLTVAHDTTPPTLLSVENAGTNFVLLQFSKSLRIGTVTNIANYGFREGLPIVSATLSADLTTVTLVTGTLAFGSNYTVTIQGIQDLATIPNTIASNTTASFTATPYTSQQIGGNTTPSTLVPWRNGYQLTGAGADFGSTYSDQLDYQYQLRTGDFDLAVHISGFAASDIWAKAGLMARETLDPKGRYAAAVATPGMNGLFFSWRASPSSSPGSAGNVAANYPDTWVRLKRAGNAFTGYASYDGSAWITLGSAAIAMTNSIYVGFALSSHSTTNATVVNFDEFASTSTNAVVGPDTYPHERIGPSSRKSCIAISEIMYKPTARFDGRNLEFIELYNSNPWFHDVSGYRITCADMNFTIPPGTIIPGGNYLVLAAVPSDIMTVYGVTNVLGPYSGSLKKSENVELFDEHGALLLTVPYSNASPWPIAGDGSGHSIILANPTYGESDPQAWEISDSVGGSPGQTDPFTPDPRRAVVINEILAHSEDPAVSQFIELYNHSTRAVDLSGCILTDDPLLAKFVIPSGTSLGPAGFIAFNQGQLGFVMNGAGGAIYLIKPDGSRVLDAFPYEGQPDRVSSGRSPDGAKEIYPLADPTPAAPNSSFVVSEVVINEIMYKPISGNDDDQYIELYNRGTNSVSLANWQFIAGINYAFPASAVIGPNGYLVIGRNITNLFASHPNLNSGNTLGNYAGKMSHSGERLALAAPQLLDGRTIYCVVDEVTYSPGGRWGDWSSGGGSSLELIDARANHRLAANWADSDESQKSTWVDIENTGILDNGANYETGILHAQVGLLDVGECLVDNIEIYASDGITNLVTNSTFEGGLGGWTAQGCHSRSSLENSGYMSARSLHVRSSDRLWTGVNAVMASLQPNKLAAGQKATLRFKARWLHGWPEPLLRLNGNWLEATSRIPVPTNLGTPGLPNSMAMTNAPPSISSVTHSPTIPAAGEPVVVTARVHDMDGLQSVVLHYRADPSPFVATLTMKDDGTGGDAVAGDGIFSATIPGYASNTLVAFYITAQDAVNGQARFPSVRNNNEPIRECLIRFGDPEPAGSFGIYHLWITQANSTRWASLGALSNEGTDCTMVNGTRVIYNSQGRWAGSPYHQSYDTPSGALCHYKWIFPDDDKFLGATSFNKIHQPGNGPGDDSTLQREQTAYTFMRALGVPWLNRRDVRVYVNGVQRGFLMEDSQTPDNDMVKEYFPTDANGNLYKIATWFEFAPSLSGTMLNFSAVGGGGLYDFLTTGAARKPARYRVSWEPRVTPYSASDFTNLFSLITAAGTYRVKDPNYVANTESLADMENVMRVFAGNHAAGNADSYGAGSGQNVYAYIGTLGTKFSLMMWDFNMVLGNTPWGPGQNLFYEAAGDYGANFFVEPTFRRMYIRALEELLVGPLAPTNFTRLLDAKYGVFTANGLNVESTSGIKSWLQSAHDSIAAQISNQISAPFTVNSTFVVSNDVVYLTGGAPVQVKSIQFNNGTYPLRWTSDSSWTAAIPLLPGTNQIAIVGVDMHGEAISGTSNLIQVVDKVPSPSPVGVIAINEIMSNPLVTGTEYLELFNTSSNLTFDMSGWQMDELGYTFPAGATISPRGFVVLTADRAAFAYAYGPTNLVYDTFPGTITPLSGTLTLSIPPTVGTNATIVTKVKYDSVAPWPSGSAKPGFALQLIDATRDNWRVGNWLVASSVAPSTPDRVNAGSASLAEFPSIWINEIEPTNASGLTNSAGLHAPWIELYNPSTNIVSLSGLYLANSYANPLQWEFPAESVIGPNGFTIVFADGATNLSTATELHANFSLSSGSGQIALSRNYRFVAQVMDYISYTNLPSDHSYGSFPDGQSFVRQEFFHTTPGTTNDAAGPLLSVAVNEWMASNVGTIINPSTGLADDWFELYNFGTEPANLTGYFLCHSLTNKTEFQIPPGYIIPPHGFLLVWADKTTVVGTPSLHVNFHLSKGGTGIGLVAPDGRIVDYVTFGTQTTDISMGRYPDGGASIYVLDTPTPGWENVGPNTPPTINPINNWLLYQGQTLSLQIHATDSDLPAQTLNYSLDPGVAGNATLDPASGLFNWSPLRAQIPATNTFTVRVTDDGNPPNSSAQSFTVITMLGQGLQASGIQGTNIALTFDGQVGGSYQLEYTDNLEHPLWLPVGSVQSGGTGKTVVNATVSAGTNRYFRIVQLP